MGTIARIDTEGFVTPAWAQSPNPDGYTWALAVSGGDLWMTDLGAMGVWRVPLATGGVTEAVVSAAALLPSIDGIAADGQGGIVFSDSLAFGLHRIDGQGSLSSASHTSDFGAPRGVDLDRTTGDVQVLDVEAGGTAVHAVMP